MSLLHIMVVPGVCAGDTLAMLCTHVVHKQTHTHTHTHTRKKTYAESMPVNPLISPRRARLYSPLGSRASQMDSGVATWQTMNGRFESSCIFRTDSRSASYGEMNDDNATIPPSANSFETSPTRRMFSARSGRTQVYKKCHVRVHETCRKSHSTCFHPCTLCPLYSMTLAFW